jgi:hypothetical protein
MSSKPVFFVIPGEITTISGGYGYDRKIIEGLRAMGKNVNLVSLGPLFQTQLRKMPSMPPRN